jgi:hypothetical protein
MGDVDVEALQRSVRYIARRHEILRTTYTLVDDEPRQIAREDLAIELDCNDLGALPATQQREAMQHLLLGEIQRVFDLEAGPLCVWFSCDWVNGEHVLLRVIHHIASDAWSTGIFERSYPRPTPPSSRGGHRSWRPCRSSTPITQRGSASSGRATCSRRSWVTGRNSSQA